MINKIKEGTWAIPSGDQAYNIVKELENFRDKYWNILGDEIFYDFIDEAIGRVEEIMRNVKK